MTLASRDTGRLQRVKSTNKLKHKQGPKITAAFRFRVGLPRFWDLGVGPGPCGLVYTVIGIWGAVDSTANSVVVPRTALLEIT